MSTDAASYRLVELADVFVKDRHRKDLGDIDALAASIASLGLLQPIVLSPMLRLIAGQRRLEAFRRLGRDKIPAVVANDLAQAAELLRAERDENTCRKEFTPSEAVALGRSLEEVEREAAKARQKATQSKPGQKVGKGGGKLPPRSEPQKTRDAVGTAIGMSGRTYEKAKAVVEAAEKAPEIFGPIKEQMDRTGKVNGAHKKLREMTKPRPAKSYPASDRFMKALTELAGDMEEIRQQYGSLPKMLTHADWNPKETVFAKQMVVGFANTFAEMKKELDNAADQ
jgi:ParB family chromosome partitioning protein